MGRPVEFNEEILKKTAQYIGDCVDSAYTQIKTEGKDSTTFENKLKVKMPTKEGLAMYLCVSRETVYNWIDKYPEFAKLVEQIEAIQADRLINSGLSGDYNPTIAKVLLSKHGYVEKVESQNAHKIETLTEAEKKKLSRLLR